MENIKLADIIRDKKVVVIGNSDINEDINKYVDEADIVFRFNHAYNMNEKSGTRCTHLVVTPCGKFLEQIKTSKSGKCLLDQQPMLLTVKFNGERGEWDCLNDLFCKRAHILESEPSLGGMTTGTNFLFALSRCYKLSKELKIFGFNHGNEVKVYFSTEASHYRGFRNEIPFQERILAALENRQIRPQCGEYIYPLVTMHTSSGVKDKNVREYKGKPLYAHTLEKVNEFFGHSVVLTDNIGYCKMVRNYNTRAVLQENPGLTVADDVHLFIERENYHGWLVLFQPTCPNLNPASIPQYMEIAQTLPHNKVAISVFKSKWKHSAIFAREQVDKNFKYKLEPADDKSPKADEILNKKVTSFKFTKLTNVSPAIPRQMLSDTMIFFGAVVLVHTDLIRQTGDIYPKDTADFFFVEHHESESLDIDSERDFYQN